MIEVFQLEYGEMLFLGPQKGFGKMYLYSRPGTVIYDLYVYLLTGPICRQRGSKQGNGKVIY